MAAPALARAHSRLRLFSSRARTDAALLRALQMALHPDAVHGHTEAEAANAAAFAALQEYVRPRAHGGDHAAAPVRLRAYLPGPARGAAPTAAALTWPASPTPPARAFWSTTPIEAVDASSRSRREGDAHGRVGGGRPVAPPTPLKRAWGRMEREGVERGRRRSRTWCFTVCCPPLLPLLFTPTPRRCTAPQRPGAAATRARPRRPCRQPRPPPLQTRPARRRAFFWPTPQRPPTRPPRARPRE